MSKFIYFTPEEKARARNTDLVSLLRAQGERPVRSGREFRTPNDPSITSAKLNTVIMRESTTMAVLLMPAVSGLPVACIMLSRVGRASTSSAARKPKAGFHALR